MSTLRCCDSRERGEGEEEAITATSNRGTCAQVYIVHVLIRCRFPKELSRELRKEEEKLSHKRRGDIGKSLGMKCGLFKGNQGRFKFRFTSKPAILAEFRLKFCKSQMYKMQKGTKL